MPNIVRVGLFIVSDYLLFVSQIEYNSGKENENLLSVARVELGGDRIPRGLRKDRFDLGVQYLASANVGCESR
jgi:hypothetical protein